MKKICLLLFCISLLVACGDDEAGDISSNRTIVYKFNAKATPTGDNNLIGVQVYKGTKGKGSELAEYAPYAYGVFDDFSKIKLDFPKEYDYKIVSTVIVDGKLHVAQDANGYLKPFSIKDKGVALTNSFEFSSNDAMLLLNKSTTTMTIDKAVKSTSNQKDSDVPPLDRYYGEATIYEGDSNENPVVDMERYVFGLELNVRYIGNTILPGDCVYIYVEGALDTLKVEGSEIEKSIERLYTYPQFTKDETPRSVNVRSFFKFEYTDELWEFAEFGIGALYRNSRKILDLNVNRIDGGASFDDKWSGEDNYYGEGN